MGNKLKKGLFLLAVAIVVMPISTISAASNVFYDDFHNGFDEDWHFVNFEDNNGVFSRNPGVACGVDACAHLMSVGNENFLRVEVNSSTQPGIYTNTDMSEVELGLPTSIESGQWNPSINKPVVMEARVRWNSAYNFNGSGEAVGSNGIILWNSAIEEDGSSQEYDHLGFSWVTNRAFFGLMAGLNATTILNSIPIGISKPLFPVNIHDWVDLKLVWSTNFLGIQSATYYVNGHLVGFHILPVPFQNLSVEIWNDNQEPQITLEGLLANPGQLTYTTNYLSPNVQQAFDVDYVKVSKE